MIRGFDCFDTPNAATLLRAANAGFKVICQYYGTPGSAKVLTATEARRISDAGLMIFPVFERSEGRPLEGRTAGTEDAALAIKQAQAAGQPTGTTICFAVDADVDTGLSSNRNALIGYFAGVRDIMGDSYRCGAYGSGDVLTLLRGVNMIEVAWLAGAMGWRGSRAFDQVKRWDIKQYPTIKIGASGNELGIEYDPDDIADIGKIAPWSPSVQGTQAPRQFAPADPAMLQRHLVGLGYPLKVDGRAGPQTCGAALDALSVAGVT